MKKIFKFFEQLFCSHRFIRLTTSELVYELCLKCDKQRNRRVLRNRFFPE